MFIGREMQVQSKRAKIKEQARVPQLLTACQNYLKRKRALQ